jgi:hypothetical protein
MTFEMKAGGGIPAGAYQAEFVRAEKFDQNAEQYGIGVLLVFKVLEGELQGEETTRIVSAKLSTKSNLHKFVQSFRGAPVEPGENIELESFYGTAGMIVVEECGDGGSTRVATFLRR